MTVEIKVGDALEVLRTMPDESVHCCITSPPYFGLRNYGVDGQLGLEETPEEYLEKMVAVFREVKRVLRDDGTCWVNMGDGYQDKQLLGTPWRLALALQADGWILRSDIIWHKKNPMPESCTDRPTKAHEYIFLLAKKARYFYDADAVREGHKHDGRKNTNVKAGDGSIQHRDGERWPGSGRNRRTVWSIATQPFSAAHFATFPTALVEPMIKAGTSEKGCCPECGAPWERVTEKDTKLERGRNKIGLGNTFNPLRLGAGADGRSSTLHHESKVTTTGWRPTCDHDHEPIPCTVLDPFAGACTVGLVADRLGRNAILIELNPEYAEMGRKRIADDAGWTAEIEVDAPQVLRQMELI